MLRKLLLERKKTLSRVSYQCNNWLRKAAPEGTLRVSSSHGTTYFYHMTGKNQSCGTKLTDEEEIKKLVLKDYYRKLIPALQSEIDLIDSLLEKENDQIASKVFEKLHPERKKYIKQLFPTREDSFERWYALVGTASSEPEEGRDFIPTQRGELVRSMNEYNIANALYRHGIPYKYEYPYRAVNGVVLHPDFYVKNKNTGYEYFWEHFGMMDKPDYVMNSMMYKIRLYAEDNLFPGNGLITTFSGGKVELDEEIIEKTIETYLI